MAKRPVKKISARQVERQVQIAIRHQQRGEQTYTVTGQRIICSNDTQVAVLNRGRIDVYDKDYDVSQRPVSFFDIQWANGAFDLCELAARCAVGSWFVTERKLNNYIQQATDPSQLLRGSDDPWFDYWSVRRTFHVDAKRPQIRDLLFSSRSNLAAAQPNDQGWRLVEELSSQIQPLNCGERPTSLVSKFAFSCCPTTFVPYDSLVRETLRNLGRGIHEHYYVNYMMHICREIENVRNALKNMQISAARLLCNGQTMPQLLFEMRTADWFLLLNSKKYSFGVKRNRDDGCCWVNKKGAAVHLARRV